MIGFGRLLPEYAAEPSFVAGTRVAYPAPPSALLEPWAVEDAQRHLTQEIPMKADIDRGPDKIWDWLIIGSGFGGSVCALRLAERGYSVLVLEKGRRWEDVDFPTSNWNLKRWLWMPLLGFRGPFNMTFFRHLTALSGVGVGGGSLIYANTLPTPENGFFDAEEWGHLADWRTELAPHYETAREMLGSAVNPKDTPADRALQSVASRTGREEYFHPAPVAVFFGDPGVTVPDPYFGGRGPDRTGCTFCGGCMTGCRYGAKNTLDRNYLWLAERSGAIIRADTEVTWVHPAAASSFHPSSSAAEQTTEGGYVVTARERVGLLGRRVSRYNARNVVFASGVLGTVELLDRLRRQPSGLPELSPRVGDRIRTNSEVLVGVTTIKDDLDLSEGVAITSVLKTDAHSSVEPCRFSSGSGFFRLLAMPHAPGKTLAGRFFSAWKRFFRSPVRSLRALTVKDWARRTTILLYMRTHEGYLRFSARRSRLGRWLPGIRSHLGDGPAPTAAIPEATAIADGVAEEIDGYVGSILTETLLGVPTTAHVLGGACMGGNANEGVIDHRHRVFGYDGLFVVDGSAMSANPGVNPSLSITAMAERAMSFIPEKDAGESDREGKGRREPPA